MDGYMEAPPLRSVVQAANIAYLLPVLSVPLPQSNVGDTDTLMFRPSVTGRFKWEEQGMISFAVVMVLKMGVNNIFM